MYIYLLVSYVVHYRGPRALLRTPYNFVFFIREIFTHLWAHFEPIKDHPLKKKTVSHVLSDFSDFIFGCNTNWENMSKKEYQSILDHLTADIDFCCLLSLLGHY